jgi:alpha-beta hydrolase superfamily lysophospholipase
MNSRGQVDCAGFTVRGADGTGLHGVMAEPAGGASSAVCLVHGLGEHSGRYGWVMPGLAGHGIGVMALDLRGHGRSPGRRGHAGSCRLLLSDIGALLDAASSRFPGLPLHLYGHSFGGSLVTAYVLENGRPDSAVVTSPLYVPSSRPSAWKRAAAGLLSGLAPGFTMSTGLDSGDLSRTEGVSEAYDSDPLVHDRISVRLGRCMLALGRRNLERAGRLRVPVLLMHGDGDRITSPGASREFSERAGDACQLRIWQGLRHELHNEPEREQVMEHLVRWLGGEWRRAVVP